MKVQNKLRPLTLPEQKLYYWCTAESRIVVLPNGWTLTLTGRSLMAESNERGIGKRFDDEAEALATARYLRAHPEDVVLHLA